MNVAPHAVRPAPPAVRHNPAAWLPNLLWLVAGAALIVGLGEPAVRRTQEARVLVTAREMLGGGPDRWLVPHANGSVRLRKPPLAYWFTAASFAVFGVSEAAGRAPAALAGWLTLAVTYAIGRFLFDWRVGLLAAAALLSCFGFAHYTTLAETDPYVALFVTAAIGTTYRGYVAAGEMRAAPSAGWFHLGAGCAALALLAKGPPAAYPIILLVTLSAIERRWVALRRSLLCGAPLTFLAIGAPWFAYILRHPQAWQAAEDLRNSAAGGGGHGEWFFEYVPQLLAVLAPWSALASLAAVAAAQRARADARLRALLVWVASILVPLCAWGNKQPHYLLPLLPPVALLVAWLVARTLDEQGRAELGAWVKRAWVATLVFLVLAAPALLAWSRARRGTTGLEDLLLALALLLAVAIAWAVARATDAWRGALALALGFSATVLPAFRWWRSVAEPGDTRALAAAVRADLGSGPYLFYRGGENLPLCFYLCQIVPRLTDEAELRDRLARAPRPVVLQALADDHPIDAPPFARPAKTYTTKGRKLVVLAAEAP
jgi:4-amino-4-deoxy-L-arabinose transferase-like glycosyltransferase